MLFRSTHSCAIILLNGTHPKVSPVSMTRYLGPWSNLRQRKEQVLDNHPGIRCAQHTAPRSGPRMSETPYESSNRRAKRIGAVPQLRKEYPKMSHNFPQFPTSRKKHRKREQFIAPDISYFILHTSSFSYASFVSDSRLQLWSTFSAARAMRLFSRTRHSLACEKTRLPCAGTIVTRAIGS